MAYKLAGGVAVDGSNGFGFRPRFRFRAGRKVPVDGGYAGKLFALAVRNLPVASVEAVKRNGLHTFAVLPKR